MPEKRGRGALVPVSKVKGGRRGNVVPSEQAERMLVSDPDMQPTIG